MNDEQKKYAELIIAMTTDLILGNIEFSHYSQTLDIINKKVQQLNK